MSGVPGLGIVDDDEDWTDKGVLEKYYLLLKRKISLFFVKQLPFGEEPIYFNSDREALEMVRKHFPGKSCLVYV